MRHTIWSIALVGLLAVGTILTACGESGPKSRLQIKLATETYVDSLPEVVFSGPEGADTLYLYIPIHLTEADVDSAWMIMSGDGPAVEVAFNREGRRTLDELVANNIGRRAVVIVDGEIVTAPVIRERVFGETVIVTGGFSEAKAQQVADAFNGVVLEE